MSDEGWDAPFIYSRLILCEGPDDAAFLGRFIADRALSKCHIRHTGKGRHSPGGNTKFDDALRAVRLNDAFSKIKRIMVVSDNDLDPEASFKNIQRLIDNAEFGPAPDKELVFGNGAPKIMVVMIPLGGIEGNLECFCLDAAKRKDARIAAKVDDLAAAIKAEKWNTSRNGKMQLRVSLAVRCEKDPFVSLQNVFSDRKYRNADLIPLADSSFNKLEKILKDFSK